MKTSFVKTLWYRFLDKVADLLFPYIYKRIRDQLPRGASFEQIVERVSCINSETLLSFKEDVDVLTHIQVKNLEQSPTKAEIIDGDVVIWKLENIVGKTRTGAFEIQDPHLHEIYFINPNHVLFEVTLVGRRKL